MDPISKQLIKGCGEHGPIALMYHSVQPGAKSPNTPWAVSLARFIEQLDLLISNGWTTLCLRDIVTQNRIAPRTAVITFDDGYADNYPAFEAITERGMRATWFIISNDVNGTSSWPASRSKLMLSSGQLLEMAGAGMEIGAHSRTHCKLTEIGAPRLTDEVAGSKAALESLIGQEIVSFAYPYGDHNDLTVEAVRKAGYKAACVTRSGWALTDNDPLRIRRLTIYANDSQSSFARKLALADNDVGWPKVARYAVQRALAKLRHEKSV